jgi:CheY-like chemotaxis protein
MGATAKPKATELSVLVADDDATFRRFVENTLSRRGGYRVTTVPDGAQALARSLAPEPPDVVVLDWLMPNMHGTQVCRAIRAQRSRQQPYIVLATARGRRAEILECMAAGADDLLQKPIAPDLLVARLDLARHRIPELDGGVRLRRELEFAVAEGRGELAIRSGPVTARVFVHDGKVAWAHVADGAAGLLETLAPGKGLDKETARAIVDECRRTGKTLSETLSAWGLVERAQLRDSIRSWLMRKLDSIRHFRDPQFLFLPIRHTYAEDMLFELDDLVAPLPPVRVSGRPVALGRTPSQIPPATWHDAFVTAPEEQEADGLLEACATLEGAVGVAVLDRQTGFSLGQRGQGLDPDLAWAHLQCLNAIIRSEGAAESIVTTGHRYHLARPVAARPQLILYVVVDSKKVLLANARLDLQSIAEHMRQVGT